MLPETKERIERGKKKRKEKRREKRYSRSTETVALESKKRLREERQEYSQCIIPPSLILRRAAGINGSVSDLVKVGFTCANDR